MSRERRGFQPPCNAPRMSARRRAWSVAEVLATKPRAWAKWTSDSPLMRVLGGGSGAHAALSGNTNVGASSGGGGMTALELTPAAAASAVSDLQAHFRAPRAAFGVVAAARGNFLVVEQRNAAVRDYVAVYQFDRTAAEAILACRQRHGSLFSGALHQEIQMGTSGHRRCRVEIRRRQGRDRTARAAAHAIPDRPRCKKLIEPSGPTLNSCSPSSNPAITPRKPRQTPTWASAYRTHRRRRRAKPARCLWRCRRRRVGVCAGSRSIAVWVGARGADVRQRQRGESAPVASSA